MKEQTPKLYNLGVCFSYSRFMGIYIGLFYGFVGYSLKMIFGYP